MNRYIPIVISAFIVVILLTGLGYVFRNQLLPLVFQPTSSPLPTGVTQPDAVEIITEGLDTPWAIAALPNGDMLVTERPGVLQRISESGQVYDIEGVEETSEGGLLGVAIHPDFDSNKYVYLYITTDSANGLINQVIRHTLADNQLRDRTIIIDNIPASQNHDGGVLAFGPDDKLYITTGDAGVVERAQDIDSLAGKILRVNEDGSIPADNPFNNEVWSYGHRNPQGLAWDDSGQLWSTEHGPSGLNSGRDELNIIIKGGNYGWPIITGNESSPGMQTPVAHSGDDETWAPAGLVYANGSLFFTGLRGQSLYQAEPKDDSANIVRHLSQQYGRLRAIISNDESLVIGTSNRDGRGSPSAQDDQLLQIPLQIFK